jgi:ABC-type bacteriocin/lantibiotic exporter with double-glycine peptidase domain
MEMDPDHVSHQTLLVELVKVSTKVDRLIQDQSDARRSMEGETGVYARLSRLEQRMAQVVILAVICGLVLPVFTTVVIDRLWPAATVEVTADPTP